MSRVMDRLLRRADTSGDCWLFGGYVRRDGYAVIQIRDRVAGKNRAHYVHRLAYVELVGPIPAGMELDHLCQVRHCFNPRHLEPVTSQVNTLRNSGVTAAHAARTECKHGHPFTPENTHYRPGGGRTCRECARIKSRRQAARRKAAA